MDSELLAFLLRDPQQYLANPSALESELAASRQWIENLTSTAAALGIARGIFCRQILPFSEETDAKDQANLSIASDELADLRTGAVRIRKFLRLKISDENDLRQAIDALNLVHTLLTN